MTRRAELRVGVLFLVGIILLGIVAWFILGYGGRASGYTFDIIFRNAQGVQEGDPVRMSGVTIGRVERVALTEGYFASVTVRIGRRYTTYDNYKFLLSAGGLIPERHVDVIPVSPPKTGRHIIKQGAAVQGTDRPGLPALMEEAEQVFHQLRRTAKTIEVVVGNQEVLAAVMSALGDFSRAAGEASHLARSLADVASEARPQVKAVLADVQGLAGDLRQASARLSSWAQRSTGPESIDATFASLRSAAGRVDALAESFQALVGDQQVQADLRAIASNLRVTSENVKEASADIRETTGEIKKGAPRVSRVMEQTEEVVSSARELRERLRFPEVKAELRMLYAGEDSRSIATANVDLIPRSGKGRFLRLGVDDIGENSSAIAQMGEPSGRTTFRYGLYRSQLGLGWDLPLAGRSRLSLDLFDPNNLRADLLAQAPLGGRSDWSFLFGLRELLEDEQLVVGARLTR
jgi:phospholipid/cholesterol/gamma-HCH transport system substrate-binding protein